MGNSSGSFRSLASLDAVSSHADAVVRSVAQHLGVPPERITGDQAFGADLGLDVFDLALVAAKIEARVGVELLFSIVTTCRTVRDLIALVDDVDALGKRPHVAAE